MATVVTNKGLSSIADASAGGFKIDLETFAITDAVGVKPSIESESLVGEILYRNEIQSIEVIDANKVKFTLYVPPGFPKEGSKFLTEVGIYLKTGELFAHSTFKAPFEKTGDFGLRITFVVVAARLGETINFTLGLNASLASAASVRTLIDPFDSETNAVVVQDAQTNADNVASLTSGSLAVRYGAGGNYWAFLGYDLAYKGYPTSVLTFDKFKLRAEVEGGFWLNDGEIVIVQIITGDGSGESRRVQYDRVRGEFTVLEKPFTAINMQSLLHIWRSTKNQIPVRPKNVNSYYVLGAGINTWKRESTADTAIGKTDLTPTRVSFVGDGTKVDFKLPASVGDAVYLDKSNFVVFSKGELVGADQYNITKEKGVSLLNGAPALDAIVDVFYYTRTPSKGSSLTFSVVDYFGDGNTWSFHNSIVPPSPHHVMVFVNQLLVPSTDYILTGTSITFTKAAPNGDVVIAACASLQELGAGTTIIRKETSLRVVLGNTTPIDLGSPAIEKKNTFVVIDGKRLKHSEYDIDDGQLKIKTIYTTSTPISILAFANTTDDVVIERFSGEDSGPQWIDPAGRYVEPNRIKPMVTTYIGVGNQTVYSMNSNATAAFVFIDGSFQDPAPITIQSNNGTIILPEPLGVGQKIDIISFQAIPDSGQKTQCDRQQFVIEADKKNYMVDPMDDGVSRLMTIVSVGGVYQHMDTYVLGDLSIEFSEQPPVGAAVQLWHFGSKVQEGYSNALSMAFHKIEGSKTEYVHEYYDAIPIDDAGDVNNTLLFANTVLQYGSEYSVDNTSGSYKFKLPTSTDADQQRAVSFVFYTGQSKTRLMTRDEMIKRYMTREEILKLGFGGGGGYNPDLPGGEVPPQTGDGKGAKVVDLIASTQVVAVSNQGQPTPQSITFTANPQNVVGDVVFRVIAGDADITYSGKTATLSYANMRSDSVTVRAMVTEVDNGSYYDTVTVVKLYDGKDSVTAILSNESHAIPADVSGVVTSYTGALTNMEIYRGSVRETDQWTFERSNSVGIQTTINRNQVAVTNLTVASAYVDITASRNGFSPIVKRFTVTMSKTGTRGPEGAAGAAATYALLTNEAFVFAASPTGVVTDFSQGRSTIKVIQNNIDETSKWNFTRTNSDGVSSTINGPEVAVTAFSASNDTGSVTINATRAGYPTITKVFSISKAKGASGSGTSVEGPRGSMSFYISGRTSWSDTVAASAASVGNGPRLNDTVYQYSNSFSQTRFWNGNAWVILAQKFHGSVLVEGTVGAEALSANIIRANSALIEHGALGTLMLAGNAVTLTQAIRQPNQNQITISHVGPVDPATQVTDPSANAILSMIVQVTGTQPCLVWSAWSNPMAYEVASGGDASYWGKNWKQGTTMSEVVTLFTMTNVVTGAVYKAGQLSSSLFPGGTTTMATNAIFQNLPAGTYVLSLCMGKANITHATIPNFACRGASLTFLETKR